MNGLTETEADTLAARLFLADRSQPYAGPWASLPADVQEPYRAQAQAAQDYFTARVIETAEHDEKVNDRYHESVTAPEPGAVALGPGEHLDGTPCGTFFPTRSTPEVAAHWWCTDHQDYVRLTPEPTPECSETCAPHLHLHCTIDCERACSTCAERVTDHFVTITRGHLDWLREKAGLSSAPQTPAGGHAPDALAMVGSEREAGTAPPAGPDAGPSEQIEADLTPHSLMFTQGDYTFILPTQVEPGAERVTVPVTWRSLGYTTEPDPLAMDDHGFYLDPVRAAAERKRVAEVVAASEAQAQVDETWHFPDPDPQRARLGTEDERLADQVRADCNAAGVPHDLTLLIRHHRADAARAAARTLGS